jgi:hypothetical protein
MGRQITFYMNKSDERDFLQHLRTTGDVVIVRQTSREDPKEQFDAFGELELNWPGDDCLLWNRSVSPHPLVKHVPQQGYYWLDSLQSEVVDVWRSKLTSEGLGMGRLWMEDKIPTASGQMESKGAAFTEWFSALCRWIKQHAVKVVDGAYVLAGVDELTKKGAELIGHVP